MTTTSTLSRLEEATPVEIDLVLYPLWAARWSAGIGVQVNQGPLTMEEDGSLKRPLPDHQRRALVEAVKRYRAEVARLNALIAPLQAEYDRRGGWTRYVLVPGGHIHRDWGCSTLYPTTTRLLIAQASGSDDTSLVAFFGETACSVCFPDAPVVPQEVRNPGRCAGSGTWDYDRSTARTGYAYGNAATCAKCGQRISISSTGKLKAHDTPAAIAERDSRDERKQAKLAKLLPVDLQFRDLHDWKVETVAGAKQALREAAKSQTIAGTTADYHSYEAKRLDKASGVFIAASAALKAKGLTEDEIGLIVDRAVKAVKKEHGLR